MTDQVNYTRDDIVAKYVALRDGKKLIEDEMKAKVADINTRLQTIENYLLADMSAHGESSFSTSSGTAFIKETVYIKVADKEVYIEFVKQQNDLNFLTVSASKTHVLEYMENTGSFPPGLNYTAVKEVGIRRGKSKE